MADNNMPIINKRVWSMVRVLYYMLRKGISKSKLQADINLLLKRGKIAGKAIIHNLVLPHLTSSPSPLSHGQHHSRGRHMSPPPTEYEFSCSNTPIHSFPVFHSKRNKHSLFFGCAHAPRTDEEEDEEAVAAANAVKMVLEMLNNHNDIANNDEKFERMMVQPSPALPGFGKSPAVPVRQLRVTDSPFPLHDVGGDRQVDEKAEKFIAKFYNDLKRQRILATPSPGRPWW
uniref:Avr9/Cf-9 rapidly elicited protein 146 n=1 Tax=Kalanchoe fedtschenkoi TaxID=63787 RepID=A0A7N0UYG0_KALFE